MISKKQVHSMLNEKPFRRITNSSSNSNAPFKVLLNIKFSWMSFHLPISFLGAFIKCLDIFFLFSRNTKMSIRMFNLRARKNLLTILVISIQFYPFCGVGIRWWFSIYWTVFFYVSWFNLVFFDRISNKLIKPNSTDSPTNSIERLASDYKKICNFNWISMNLYF